ncbi:hypothetical protein EUX98_g5595 [Antrodiella citrinella]|uniref:3-carboxymuconate cyclase n=1 Tax=Antrodiella citrinella TaxID=2447956 RepID=A0A4S4MS02_9APHY|nr:hypothetical protein EUX98_g5595 [Antrodiella citrinella]
MKSSVFFVQIISILGFVAAAPTPVVVPRGGVWADESIQAAAYLMTNEPSGNNIIVASLASNGQVTFKSAVSTRGRGAHVTGNNGPDPLMSQGSIETSATGQLLAAVNAGSSTVSLFSINPQDPTMISQIGEPVSSEGEFPVSLAINKKGDAVCVLNAGQVNGVNCFAVDKSLGLVRMNNTLRSLNLVADSGPSASAAHHVAFNDANDQLIATVVGTPGYLAIWDIQQDGSLSPNFTTVNPPSGGGGPFSLTAVPGTNAMVSADTVIGADVWDLDGVTSATTANQTAPGRSASVAISGQMVTCWSTFSNKTGNFYFVDAGAATVTEVNLSQNLTATVVNQYPQVAGSATLDVSIAAVGGNEFMYVIAGNTTSVDVLDLRAPGNATNVGSFNFGPIATSSGITVNAANVQGMATFVKA